ncbi:AraC family transcriptional regulator [Variovorax dokdonensis]|uniref:AraC family transcriptional regulator n=1 Tax=Variovorax dokdonensis TaxID=344883 RepID=A0ABT7N5S9_9BURK|nr:AraC family transcriptional regulator [Variovorax dokdonensis]MDM0043282.1 AraC family transcriptional regulator [Variovorax dokdonensis]
MIEPTPLSPASSRTTAALPGSDNPTQILLRRAELAACIARMTTGDGAHETAIPRLRLIRATSASELNHTLHEPAICLPVQGRKRVLLGDELTVYDTEEFLVVSQDVPISSQVMDATPESPYLCVKISFSPGEVAALLLDLDREVQPRASTSTAPCARALYTSPTTLPLLDAMLRLVRLLDTPQDIGALAPLAVREILYRLLTSPEGWRLAQIGRPDGQGPRIAEAIGWLRHHYREPLKIDQLAHSVHMSGSSLHRHFRAVTAMSPLQFQKALRLQEARRLMLVDGVDATSAGYQVGYESASQFSREYARMFGAPPARDMRRMRQDALDGATGQP